MAFISEIMYKETRNPDGSLFSQQMEARCILKENELPYPLDEQVQAEAVVLREGGLLIEFVRQNLDKPFKRADESVKVQPAQATKPVELPGAAPKESPKPVPISDLSSSVVPPEPAYDKDHLIWLRCPNNSKHQIRQLQTQRGKTQQCEACNIWLNADGKIGRMK